MDYICAASAIKPYRILQGVSVSKRDIKAKRWLKRRLRREHGEWWKPVFTVYKVANGMRAPANAKVFVCGRRPGMNTIRTMRDIWCG